MFSPFIINDKNLSLERYPVAQVNRSLQAWDAADEYLVNHISEQGLLDKEASILIFNDAFGALAANFNDHPVYSVTDSYLSEQGTLHNLAQNGLNQDKLTQLTSLDELPSQVDLVIYKIPKSNSLLTEQLIKIKQALNPDSRFIGAARAKDIHGSTLKLFEKHLGTTTTSLAVKKARLVFSELDNQEEIDSPFPTCWQLENTTFSICNHANVFAREKLDIGARYFIQSLPEINANANVIDLGCGNGVIGLTVLARQASAQVTFVDESYMAVASARENIAANLADKVEQCQFLVNDCLTNVAGESADIVLCNPPFHQQNATTDHIAWQMFKDSYRVLKKGGELRIIGNRQLGYHVKLKRIFGNSRLIASNNKFVTLSAKKL